MRTSRCLLVLLACTATCAAKEHPDYQKGKILQMESTACGLQEKGNKTVAGEILHLLAQKTGADHHPLDALAGEQRQLVIQKGFARHIQQRFWNRFRKRPHARGKAAGQQCERRQRTHTTILVPS